MPKTVRLRVLCLSAATSSMSVSLSLSVDASLCLRKWASSLTRFGSRWATSLEGRLRWRVESSPGWAFVRFSRAGRESVKRLYCMANMV
ncbi:hypothetical protein B0H21DRAFT_346170 [Amylocystis lapponica]|nr:hypothetical protein B0H21DRAFT_346170 [Amylocystis lapponica]